MYRGVHAEYKLKGGMLGCMANRIRIVIQVWTERKKIKGIDEVLNRLYEPILWRSLYAPNAIVRRNAASLMIDAFPIHDPDGAHDDIDAAIQKQFDALAVWPLFLK